MRSAFPLGGDNEGDNQKNGRDSAISFTTKISEAGPPIEGLVTGNGQQKNGRFHGWRVTIPVKKEDLRPAEVRAKLVSENAPELIRLLEEHGAEMADPEPELTEKALRDIQ